MVCTVEHNPSDNTFTFFDQAGASTKDTKHEDLKESAVNPHTGDPARPEAFDHKQQAQEPRWWAACPEHGKNQFPSGSCHECAMLQPASQEDDWTRNYDEERDHKSYTSSLKTATIHVTSADRMPQQGTPEAAELKIAIQTLKMPEPMQGVMGGPGTEHALQNIGAVRSALGRCRLHGRR